MAEQLKNLYSKEFIEKLANKLFLTYSDFQKEKFINSIFDTTPDKKVDRTVFSSRKHAELIQY